MHFFKEQHFSFDRELIYLILVFRDVYVACAKVGILTSTQKPSAAEILLYGKVES